MPNVKLKFFPQSNVIDAALSRKILADEKRPHQKLDQPILYRGDTRPPSIIFKTGFYRIIADKIYRKPFITNDNGSSDCIATTKNLVYAMGFADCPMPSALFQPTVKKNRPAYVYVFFANEGIDLSLDTRRNNLAKSVNEVVLTGVPAEHIIAALEIVTTDNEIEIYSQRKVCENIAWQIKVNNLFINPNCDLNGRDEQVYQKVIQEFTALNAQGYYRIPWAEVPEDKDFGLTYESTQAKQIDRINQLEDLQKADVMSKTFLQEKTTVDYNEKINEMKRAKPHANKKSTHTGLFKKKKRIAVIEPADEVNRINLK